jgi:hypothetical protein
MARTTKQLSGGGKDKFLRALVATEADLPADTAARLCDNLCAAIADIRVRRDTWDAIRETPAAEAIPAAVIGPVSEVAPPKAKPAKPTVVDLAPPASFDPFVFSALAVLAKKGTTALSDRLVEITSARDLHALAAAQHLSVDASVTDVTALRAAILAAAEARLAERRAAAS